MDEFMHRRNLALFKERLDESHSDAEREVLLKLLEDEKTKELHRKIAFSSRVDPHQRIPVQAPTDPPMPVVDN